MTRDTRIALFLMGELVAALRANDSDLFKRWLYGGIEDLGEPAVTELLLLFRVEPALTTGLLWRFVVAAVLIHHAAKSGDGAHRPFANGNQRVVCTNGFGIIRRIALGRCSAAFP